MTRTVATLALAIVAAFVLSGCSGSPRTEPELAPQGPLRIQGVDRQAPAHDSLLPFTTVTSNGTELFSWRVRAFVPTAFIVHLTEDTSAFGMSWRPLQRSRVPDDSFFVYAVAPEREWNEATFQCGARATDWLVGIVEGGMGNLTYGFAAGRWVVLVVATKNGTAALSLGRSAVANPQEPEVPRTPVDATNAVEPALVIDASVSPANPAGTQFQATIAPAAASMAWTIVRGTHAREPTSRIEAADQEPCMDQVGANEFTSDPSAPGFVHAWAALAGGEEYTWSGIQARYAATEGGPRGALALAAPRVFPTTP